MASRRNEIVKLRQTGSYAKIGRRLGISRERVREIANGNPTRQKPGLHSRVMLTSSDVAQLLGLHPNTVRRWSQKGLLKAYRIGPRGDRRFRREEIDVFLRKERVAMEVAKAKGTAHGMAMKLETRVFELCNVRYKNLVHLARAMGISSTQVYRAQQGKCRINQTFIIGAVRAFPGYKLDDLFYVAPGLASVTIG